MSKNEIFCISCFKYKEARIILEQNGNVLECPVCHNSFQIDGQDLLEEYEEEWNENSKRVLWNIRPAFNQNEIGNPRLYFLYMDCYHTLLVGRYNASIVMIGVLVEVILKEIIRVRTGEEFKKPFGPCLQKIIKNKLMTESEIKYLKEFKNKIRNPYQHGDDGEILKDIKVPIWPIKFKNENNVDGLKSFLEKINSGTIKPVFVPASEVLAIRPLSKQSHDQNKAIKLFNEVHDFLFVCNIRYFNQKDYDGFHKMFPQKDVVPYYYEI